MYKLIALWSHPRSMSTAMERIMRERGDLICHHEPFMYDYYVHRKVREMPYFEVEQDRPQSYQDIRKMLLDDTKHSNVFFKDMSYYVMPGILEDLEFSNRTSHCFLIRDPIASILSYYKLDNEVTLEEIGLEAQWKHYYGLTEKGFKPLVIEAKTVQNNPRQILSQVWEKVGIPYEEKAFDWQEKNPEDWGQVSGWHGSVIGSDGIKAFDPEKAERKSREFEDLCKIQPHLQKYFEHHYPFFEKLKREALTI